MKNLTYLSLAILLIASCQSEPSKTVDTTADSIGSVATVNADADAKKSLVVPWNVQVNETTQAMEIKKDPAAKVDDLSAADLVQALNLKYPEIKLEWVKQEGDKVYVNIADAAYLTNQSGNEGAKAYMAEATYSLTELKGISAVVFKFEEGDHARPGVYTRADFQF